MVNPYNQSIGVTRLFCLFLCLVIFSLCSCSSLKPKRDDDVFVQGTTVPLDELEYTKGTAKPLPEPEEPETPQTVSVAETDQARRTAPPVGRPDLLRHLKKRLFVLPFENTTSYRDEPYGDMLTQKIVQALEGSEQVVVLDGDLLSRFSAENDLEQGDLLKPLWTKELHRVFGVQAVVSGSLVQLNVGVTPSSVSPDIEVGLAIARIHVRLADASTGSPIRTYTTRNPLYKSQEIGEFNQERSILRAIDIGVDEVARSLLNTLSHLEWSARIVRTEPGRVYIGAGQQSGLRVGEILDVYGPGQEIINPVSQISLGWAPGPRKGRIEVSGFFGLDGAYATPIERNHFETGDLVKVSQDSSE